MTTGNESAQMTVDAELLAGVAAELAGVLAAKADLEQTERMLKTQLRELLPDAGTYPAGGVSVVVSPNRRFNPDAALPLIDPVMLPLVTMQQTVVDKDRLKALLPGVFDAAQTVGEPRISLR